MGQFAHDPERDGKVMHNCRIFVVDAKPILIDLSFRIILSDVTFWMFPS